MDVLNPRDLYYAETAEEGFLYSAYDDTDPDVVGPETQVVEEELMNHVEEGNQDGKFGFMFFGAYMYDNPKAISIIQNILKAFQLEGISSNRIVIHESCAFESGMNTMGISISVYNNDFKIRNPETGKRVKAIYRLTLIMREERYTDIKGESKILKQRIEDALKDNITSGEIEEPVFFYKENNDQPSVPL